MAQVFLGSLMLVPYNFAPYGWAFCTGQLLQISSNTALFSLLGTSYGGDGIRTFALPNLQGSVPVGQGQGPGLSPYVIGQTGGVPSVTLLTTETPTHSHNVQAASASGDVGNPNGAGLPHGVEIYTTDTSHLVKFNANTAPGAGGNLPHNNLMPYLTLNWIIALQGIYPARQ